MPPPWKSAVVCGLTRSRGTSRGLMGMLSHSFKYLDKDCFPRDIAKSAGVRPALFLASRLEPACAHNHVPSARAERTPEALHQCSTLHGEPLSSCVLSASPPFGSKTLYRSYLSHGDAVVRYIILMGSTVRSTFAQAKHCTLDNVRRLRLTRRRGESA